LPDNPRVSGRGGEEGRETTLLFVYGTLKRGFRAHHLLGGAQFLGARQTLARFSLVDCGTYPALVPGQRAVEGELYEVDLPSLRTLDAYEGGEYVRERIQLQQGEEAQAYVLRAECASTYPRIDAASWPNPRHPDGLVLADRSKS
jgi:gamma-glutamylcyclotransferase (GGCT)/AIG2-like uncharacterized protein YtfP